MRLQIKSKQKKPKFPSGDKKMREYINVLENRIDELER
nr:MAG TPA: zipper dimerization domain transcription factor-like protein [Caudoviricetes sp.]DAP94600.1 MAG TPA: zipper dimerization domain transcription factor-like protein [Caudoviricetes sp.]DAT74277.1 MAG TPA: zipper dimerization domain transcription factor-like protein [Caudoviricetes sp.]DAX50037.1 MAG TPA: zipper dimerization domain transcription factor-like protein [Caudoviricetes sp.]